MNLAPALQRALLLTGLAGTACAVALSLETIAAQERAGAEAALALVREQSAQARAAEAVRATHGDRYRQLRAGGVIGTGPRLALVEALRRSARDLRLRTITFEMEPATALPPPWDQVMNSRMKLHVGLVHEGELFRLFERLRAHAPAVPWPRHCALQRPEEEGPMRRDEDNLTADCEVDFLTVGPAARARP